ncbi:F-box only protein 10-like isoform X2 [Saccostrea echinata]|uniref:F-box only protein 10-like isoform X2 n=1 Tax=Saccostrea echinata TaxID=191078 RepID=UPI002A83EB5C|nr:F-box only protein 10-like isoform X2 [Saccostrea echinata]
MSIPSVKPDIGSKVLPGDKTGLPWEIWRIILSYLSAEELCRCACTCKTWNDLVISLDSSRWKELYLQCSDWKHPFWPINTDSEPASWKLAFKEQYLSVRFWGRNLREPDSATCLYVLKRRKERKVIQVGRDMQHTSLKSALAVANDYDRIEIYPGIYDEQFEMSSKIPFEIIGVGELGSIILVVCVEQIALTGRVSNLVFRAPWFTNFVLKVRVGYLQVDNCIFEDGMVYVQNPGSCHIKFCTFRHATVILQHLNSSIIENCEFSKTDSAAITVEGFPREDRNWTYGYMMEKIAAVSHLNRTPQKGYKMAPPSAFSTSTAVTQKWLLEKSSDSKTESSHDPHRRQSYCSSSFMQSEFTDTSLQTRSANKVHGRTTAKHSFNIDQLQSRNSCFSSHTGELTGSARTCEFLSQSDSSNYGGKNTLTVQGSSHGGSFTVSEISNSSIIGGGSIRVDIDDHDKSSLCSGMIMEEEKPTVQFQGEQDSVEAKEQSKTETESGAENIESVGDNSRDPQEPIDPPDEIRSRSPSQRSRVSSGSRSHSPVSTASGSDIFDDSNDSIGSYNSGSVNSRGSSSSSEEEEGGLLLSDTDSDFSDEEESVIMLTCPQHQQPRSVSAASIGADVVSICSQNQSENIRIIADTAVNKVTEEVRGCLIHRCRMSLCKGGVMVSLQAHAIISHCDINGVGYGIRCIQNARVIILKNEIHHCRTSGVFMRLAASGLVAGNDIHSNCEAGIDIRKNADPLVMSNRIHHGKRSGIVVLGSGRGQIRNNEIYQNKEAGLYILYRGNPTVSKNQIFSGKAAGVAVNEGGKGYICDNIIRENQWGGVDIRHGGDPVITQNIICNGMSDGIVIGDKGRGSIENNIITGNAGCGVWITAASQPLIHGNQINNNLDTGVTFVNKTDEAHEDPMSSMDRSDVPSQKSSDFWQFMNDEQPHHRRSCTKATVEYNSIYHNNGRGVFLMFGDEVDVKCNAVHGNRGDGIHIDQEFPVLVKDNSVTCNAGNGLITSNVGEVSVTGNGIFDNRDHGIFVKNEAVLEENDIIGNQRSALQLERNTKVLVEQNRLQSLSDRAITIISVQDGTVNNNQVYSVNPDPVLKTTDSKCQLKDNKIIHIDTTSGENGTKASKDLWMLKDPPARPHIEAPPTIPTLPANQVTSVTRVTVPSAHNCEEGSKLCIIL